MSQDLGKRGKGKEGERKREGKIFTGFQPDLSPLTGTVILGSGEASGHNCPQWAFHSGFPQLWNLLKG